MGRIDPEARRAYAREWRKKNLAKSKAYGATDTAHKRRNNWYMRNKEKQKTYRKVWELENYERMLLAFTKSRAKKLCFEFNLTIEDIVIPRTCPVLGIELVKGGDRFYNSPSIDRVDNSKGYIKGNICIISAKANNLKKDATLEELEALVRYVKTWN